MYVQLDGRYACQVIWNGEGVRNWKFKGPFCFYSSSLGTEDPSLVAWLRGGAGVDRRPNPENMYLDGSEPGDSRVWVVGINIAQDMRREMSETSLPSPNYRRQAVTRPCAENEKERKPREWRGKLETDSELAVESPACRFGHTQRFLYQQARLDLNGE